MKAHAIFLALLLVGVAVAAGCFKRGGGDELNVSQEQQKANDILGTTGSDKLVDAAAIIPKNYSFPLQQNLAPVQQTFSATISTDAVGGYEAERDEGGIDYNTKTQMFDVGPLLPPGQPAEIVLKVFWDASEVNSADLDLVVDLPGLQTSYSTVSETWNWNYAVKTMVVDTIGVEGQPAQVGVQVASAAVTKGFDFKLDVSVTYVKDVLTPYHAWALDVPTGASGIILESEKAGGDEHITSQFILVDPEDNLVQFVDFNDISIPTQSVFIPTATSGTYVFYAYSMHGGFLRAKADVPLSSPVARPLALVEKPTVDSAAPMPGVAGKDVLNGTASMPADDVAPTTVPFAPEGPFPLRVTPYIKGQATAMAKITLSSPLGKVAQRTAWLRYQDDRGTIGYTSDHEGSTDVTFDWKNIAKGAWKADIVNDNPAVELGHVVLTYERS